MSLDWLADLPWYAWGGIIGLVGLVAWQYRPIAVLLGRDLPPEQILPDDVMWRAGDVFAAGLSVPVVIIDYDRRVRVYNRGAEDLTGHPFHAVHGHSFGLMLSDDDEDSFRGWIDRYLKEYREGDVVQMVGERRRMTLVRPDGRRRQVSATLTHFGNGHGGIQIELLPAV